MNVRRFVCLLPFACVVGCVMPSETERTEQLGTDESALEVEECSLPPGDPCQAIPVALDEALLHVDAAIAAMDADVAANGPGATPPGAYASAPVQSRTHFKNVRTALIGAEPYADASTGPGGYAYAYQVHAGTEAYWGELWHAGHWATISAVYHGSTDARSAYDHAASARFFTNQMSTFSAACYTNAYMPP